MWGKTGSWGGAMSPCPPLATALAATAVHSTCNFVRSSLILTYECTIHVRVVNCLNYALFMPSEDCNVSAVEDAARAEGLPGGHGCRAHNGQGRRAA